MYLINMPACTIGDTRPEWKV